jgi:hypothetical protein
LFNIDFRLDEFTIVIIFVEIDYIMRFCRISPSTLIQSVKLGQTFMLSCVNLMQPWADAIVEGYLPILARSFPVRKRGIIGIASTNGMDGVFLETLSDEDLKLAEKHLAFDKVIGSVRVDNCIEVRWANFWNEVQKIGGRNLYQFYPSNFLPMNDPIYIWVFSCPVRFRKPLTKISKGISWSSAEEDAEAMKPSMQKVTFWKKANYERFKEINRLLREDLAPPIKLH